MRYSLNPNDLVIADRERAVAIAGVMGGSETEVTDRTRNILLESAFFHPRWVRKTSLRLGLTSESSYRFERRVDPEGVDLGQERAIYLFKELTGARVVSQVLKAGRKPTLEKSKVHVSLEQTKKLLGMPIKPNQIHSALTRLGLEVKNEGAETWVVGIPSYRPDLERPVDLIEEIARTMGYESVPESLPERPPLDIPPHPLHDLEERTRDFLAGLGLFETVTYSLVNPSFFTASGFDLKMATQIHNPIHQELTLLRPSFLVSLLEVLARNERAGAHSVSIFEVANVYSRKSKGEPHEEKTVGILLAGEKEAGWSDPKRPFNFFDLKGILECYFEFLGLENYSLPVQEFPFLAIGTKIQIGKETAGFLGEASDSLRSKWDLRSQAFYAEISLEKLLSHLAKGRKFKEIPRYPAVERDLSLVFDESVPTSQILSEIENLGKKLIHKVELFDLFRGGRVPKGKKNLAFRIVYQSRERTLLSEEVQALHNQITSEITKKFQAALQEVKASS
ncbi:MAG: phenylalanine--tRNA ligase subunit beta [Candidatus Omnitrophica bacterium]|nr:phenylalanine--tRNA ligase subunit beta [Candidatus Omnitrophota bacterium]